MNILDYIIGVGTTLANLAMCATLLPVPNICSPIHKKVPKTTHKHHRLISFQESNYLDMNSFAKTTKNTACLLLFLISCYVFLSSVDKKNYLSFYLLSIIPLSFVFILVASIILTVRTTTLACITVVVLLAFAGKRHRVLVNEGRKIASDVALYLVHALKERSIGVLACAIVVCLIFFG